MGKSLTDWGEEYKYFSEKASEANKSLAFGGLAIIWLFKQDSQNAPLLEAKFIWPLAFLTLSLAFDLVHYLVGAYIWHGFFIHHEKKTPLNKRDNIEAPVWKRDLVSSFFYLKIGASILAYVLLVIILTSKLY